jgi:hypothetical protein
MERPDRAGRLQLFKWRRGQESNLSRLLRTDNGFEDREGHQAPFTLRKEEEENAEPAFAWLRRGRRSTSNIERRIAEKEGDRAVGAQIFGTRRRVSLHERLFCFLDCADDGVEVRPIAGIEFGMEQFAIGANFKSAAARWNERERFDAFAEFKNFGRQTDGLRRVVSNDAIFDRHLGFHRELLPGKMVRSWTKPVKGGKNKTVGQTPRARC